MELTPFELIAAFFIQAAISRSREYNADTDGAAISGDPMYLASPLEKDSETYSDGSRNRPPGQLLVRSKRN